MFFLFQSKQRASIKWLLSKAFNNRVPDNLQEPFYRDHEVGIIKRNVLKDFNRCLQRFNDL